MPSPLPYRNHYHRDWISSSTIRQMGFAAKGIYTELLDVQWEDGFIPEDPASIMRILHCSEAEWAEFAPFLDKCFPLADDGRQNARCAEERDAAIQKVSKNRESGKLGGKRLKSQTECKADGSDIESEDKPNPKRTDSADEANAKRTLSERQAIPDTDTELEREKTAGVGARDADPPDPVDGYWWLFTDDELARDFAIGIRRGHRYEDDVPSERECTRLADFIREKAPDQSEAADIIEAFIDETRKHKGREYVRPGTRLLDWLKKREAVWAQVKRERQKDVEREARAKGFGASPRSDDVENRKEPKEGIDWWNGGSAAIFTDDSGNVVDGATFLDAKGKRKPSNRAVQISRKAIVNGAKVDAPFDELAWYRSRGWDAPGHSEAA